MEIRFHLDESVSAALARALQERTIDATTSVEARLLSASDEDHLAFGLAENRAVITHDDDYLRLNAKGTEHAGILYCHQQKYQIGELLWMILVVYECYSAEELRGQIVFL